MCCFHVLYNVRKRTKHMEPATRKAVMDGIVRIHYTDNMNTLCSEKEAVLSKWREIPELTTFSSYFTERWLDSRFWRWQAFHTPAGFATTNNPRETFNALTKKYTGRRRLYMQRLFRVRMTIIEDAPKRTPATETKIQVASTTASRAASAMINTGKVLAFATDNPALCRVKQLRKDDVPDNQELDEICQALDGPFNADCESRDELVSETAFLGPALLVRE
ncbi:hypothetical protein V7S43_019089 [Phytophthora oleae]|uniref:MULE transposase domain-containing protein n=1 Tax=Phytophthora oleae TaxID=2107226 RepID=A0ABD3F5H7_9STRA